MADIASFVAQYGPAAAASAAQLGTTPENVLGHWGLETGWGRSVIPGTNNMGNIKSMTGQGVDAVDNQLGTTSKYAAYASPEAGAAGYTKLMSNPRYAAALSTDPQQFANGLKSGGYAEDPRYVSKLTGAIDSVHKVTGTAASDNGLADQKAQLAKQVAEDYAAGVPALTIVTGLLKTKLAGGDVQAALQKGVDPAHIVNVVGGDALAQFKATDPGEKVKSQGFGTNAYQHAGNAVDDMKLGAKQIIATDPQEIADLQAQAKANESDPTRQALSHTVGGTIGNFGVKALPYAAAALLPELSVPAMIAAQGAAGLASGALKPTTADGQRLGNTLTEGAIGAGTAGAGALIGKGLTSAAGRMLSGSPEEAAAVAARAKDAAAQGLPVNAASLSGPNGFFRNIAEGMPNSGGVKAFQAKADQAIAGKVGEGLGVMDHTGPIDTNLLNTARPAIKQALDDATNVSVTLPQSLKSDLQGIIGGAKNPLTQGIATDSTVSQAATNLVKAVDSGAAVSGRQLQDLASELKALTQNQAASATERQVAGQMVGKVNEALTSAMSPQQAAAFATANKQYAALKAVEKMVSASGDTGIVTPRQMINAVKTGRFKNAFLQSDAPFQELASTASDLYGPASGKGLGSMLAKAAGGHSEGFDAAAVLHPTVGIPALLAKKAGSALLGKLATSENPTLVRLLSGQHSLDPTTAAFIAKALGNAGAVSTAG